MGLLLNQASRDIFQLDRHDGGRLGEIPTTGGKLGGKQSERIANYWLINTGQLMQLYIYIHASV